SLQACLESRLIVSRPFAVQPLHKVLGRLLLDGEPVVLAGVHRRSCCLRSAASCAIPLAKCFATALAEMPSISATVATLICSSLMSISTVLVRTFIPSSARTTWWSSSPAIKTRSGRFSPRIFSSPCPEHPSSQVTGIPRIRRRRRASRQRLTAVRKIYPLACSWVFQLGCVRARSSTSCARSSASTELPVLRLKYFISAGRNSDTKLALFGGSSGDVGFALMRNVQLMRLRVALDCRPVNIAWTGYGWDSRVSKRY